MEFRCVVVRSSEFQVANPSAAPARMLPAWLFDRSASSAKQNRGTSATSNRGASQVGGHASQQKTPLSTGSNYFFLLIASISIRFPKDPGNANYKFSLNGSFFEV